MTIWGVRAGSNGENESVALDQSLAVIGWSDLGDLTAITSRDSLLELYRKTWPDSSEKRLLNQASQVWRFKDSIALDDLVVLPLKTRPQVAVGRVEGLRTLTDRTWLTEMRATPTPLRGDLATTARRQACGPAGRRCIARRPCSYRHPRPRGGTRGMPQPGGTTLGRSPGGRHVLGGVARGSSSIRDARCRSCPRSLGSVQSTRLATHRFTASRHRPGQRHREPALRVARSREHDRPHRCGARPWHGHPPHRPTSSRLTRARPYGSRPPRR